MARVTPALLLPAPSDPRLRAALAREDRTEWRAARREFARLAARATATGDRELDLRAVAAWLSARTDLRAGKTRACRRRIGRLVPLPLLRDSLALLADAAWALGGIADARITGLERAWRGALPRLRDADPLTRAIHARAAADWTDALWMIGRRKEALRAAHRVLAILDHGELRFRVANFLAAGGRVAEARRVLAPLRAGAGAHVPALLLAADLDPRPRARQRALIRAAPRGEMVDVARWRLALERAREGPAGARAARTLLGSIVRALPASPLRGSARAVLRSLQRPRSGSAVRLEGFPGVLQERNACVGTSVTLVARWWSTGGAGRRLDRPGPQQGVPFLRLPETARRQGLRTAPVRIQGGALPQALAAGIPVFLPELAGGDGHLVIAIGWDARLGLVAIRDPALLTTVEVPRAEVRRNASRFAGLGLAAAPSGAALPVDARAETAWQALRATRRLLDDGAPLDALEAARAHPEALRTFEVELLLRAGRADAALRAARHGLRRGPRDYDAWRRLADAAWINDRLTAAAAAYRAALRRAPRDPVALRFLGMVLHQAGDLRRARRALLAACEADPRVPDSHRELLAVALALGDRRTAAEESEWLAAARHAAL